MTGAVQKTSGLDGVKQDVHKPSDRHHRSVSISPGYGTIIITKRLDSLAGLWADFAKIGHNHVVAGIGLNH
jgi:hypothetical protein